MFTPVLAKAMRVCPPGMLAPDSHLRMMATPILDNSENSIWVFPIDFLQSLNLLPRDLRVLSDILTFHNKRNQNLF